MSDYRELLSSLDDLASAGDSLCRDAAEAIRAMQALRSHAGAPEEWTLDQRDFEACEALYRGEVSCSDQLPPEKRPHSMGGKRMFRYIYELRNGIAPAQPSSVGPTCVSNVCEDPIGCAQNRGCRKEIGYAPLREEARPSSIVASDDTPETDAHLAHLNLPDGRKVGIPNETVELLRKLERDRDMWLADSAKQNDALGRVIAERDALRSATRQMSASELLDELVRRAEGQEKINGGQWGVIAAWLREHGALLGRADGRADG